MRLRSGLVFGVIGAVIVAAVVAVVVIGGREPMADSANPSSPPSQSPMAEPSTSAPAPNPAATDEAAPAAGVYRDYSESAVANAEGRILLFFYAAWCPQCRAMEADIIAEGIPDGITILVVDYDTRQDLREQYGVTLQTTFVEVDSNGAALRSHVAYSEPTLDAVLAALI